MHLDVAIAIMLVQLVQQKRRKKKLYDVVPYDADSCLTANGEIFSELLREQALCIRFIFGVSDNGGVRYSLSCGEVILGAGPNGAHCCVVSSAFSLRR